MRVDIAFIAPKQGERVYVRQMKGRFPSVMRFDVIHSDLPDHAVIPTIPLNPVAKLDLDNAQQIDFLFEWEGAVTPVGSDGKSVPKFWLTNKAF